MPKTDFLTSFSLPEIYGYTILLVLVTMGIGNYLGRRSVRHGTASDASLGSAVAATLGLLAFMLAFTFNMAADLFNQRKVLLLSEVNTLATTYLRADLLPAAERRQARALVAKYVELRDINPKSVPDFDQRIAASEAVQDQLWQLVARLSAAGYDGERLQGFYEPLNQLIDAHTSRLYVGIRYRIPTPIWVVLYAITALAMFGIGFQLGTGRRGSPQVALTLALAFSVVILLIADLDRGAEGWLLVEQTPMSELNARLQRAERAQHSPVD
ncbi:hypothetical protein [Microbulbifer sp. SAOS-129_SWC]|uniref:bestrophin-like domain n=1 Tax=Microbulbifer sp. SAOS-129_SWC TaxID=3145235 RepID=UPI0032178CBE